MGKKYSNQAISGKLFIALLACLLLTAGVSVRGYGQQDTTKLVTNADLQDLGLDTSDSDVLSRKVSLNFNHVSIEKLLTYLERKAHIQFSYDKELFTDDPTLTLQLNDVTLEKALNEILQTQPINYYALKGGYVVLRKHPFKTPVQQETITGTVSDGQSGETLPGVNILVKGTSTGASTNADGQYELEVESLQDTLVVSFVGYKTQQVPINGRTEIDVVLQSQAISGEEMVVVGYGTQEKESLTGAISSVSSENFEKTSPSTPVQALQGKISGVKVSTASHEPGGSTSIKVRGISSLNAGGTPLYVINGMPISRLVTNSQGGNGHYSAGSSPNPLNSIPPSSIASINILKGPSASAIYGSRATNGVVLITLKKGSNKQKINFESSVGVQTVRNKLHLMNAHEYAVQANERADQLGLQQYYTNKQISSLGKGTDWQNEMFRTAPRIEESLSFSGGTKDIQYFLTGSYSNTEGVIRNSSFKRYNLTTQINANPINHLSVGGSLLFSTTVNQKLRTDRKGYGGQASVIGEMLTAPPTIPARDSTGQPVNMNNYTLGGGIENPLVMTDKYEQRRNRLRLIGNTHITYDITEGLSFKTQVGFDINDLRAHTYFPIGSEAGGSGGKGSQNDSRIINILTENTLTYQKDFAQNQHIKLLAGFTYQQEKHDRLNGAGSGFPTNYYKYNNLSLSVNPSSPSTSASRWQLISYLGRINYSFKNTFLLTAAGRVDGSSKFGTNNKYGVFPSVSLAWRLGNEPFINRLNLFSRLKLRASYGQTGNDAIGNYRSLSTINTGIGSRYSPYWNGQRNPYANPSGIANPDLSWEKTKQYNFGIDAGFFSQRLQLIANYYFKKTTSLLLNLPIPSQSGFENILRNTGSMNNKGFELELSSNNFVGTFNWDTNFNISFNRNKITSLGGANYINSGFVGGGNVKINNKKVVRLQPGHPIGTFYGSVTEGVWQSQDQIERVGTMPAAKPGDKRFKDINGDGTYSPADDDIFLANPNPNFSYGLTNNFNYKSWGLSIFMYGDYGSKILNLTSEHYVSNGLGTSAKRLNRWTPKNPNTNIPGAAAGVPQRVNSSMIEDGSFLRIQNVTLSYQVPAQKLQKTLLRKVKVGLAIDNLAVITGYSGYDPEANAYGLINTVQNMDLYAYPSARTFRFTINLGF